MSDKLLFYYLGDDEAYFRTLQSEIKKHAKIPHDFHRIYESDEAQIQALFIKVFNNKPACVFIDFSKQTQDYLHLARLISRTPLDHKMLTVGLVDLLSPSDILKESIATGINFTFIKSAEIFDVVYSTIKSVAPEAMGEHGFATADLSDDLESSIICKIGYIFENGVHIETDINMSKGDRLLLNHHWLKKRIVPSRQVFVTETSTKNLFYHYKLTAELDFLFVDDFMPPEGMVEADIKERQDERNQKIAGHKKLLKKWIDDNMISSLEKKAKILVVDSKFHIYQDHKRTDKYPYTIRCMPFFTDYSAEIDRFRPQVIAFELESGDNTRNNMESLKKLVSTLMSSFADFNPFIIVFSSTITSQEIQGAIQYKNVLAHNEEMSAVMLIKLADMLQKKVTTNDAKSKEKPIKRFFINKTNRASIGELVKQVKLIKLSETDLVLQSDQTFPPGTNLHFTSPVDMFVHVIPSPKPSGKLPEYIGYIHCISETDKKELRKFINSVFFRDLDAQKTAESDEFKNLNEQKLQERLAIEAKEKEKALEEAKHKEAAATSPEPQEEKKDTPDP